MKLYVNEDITKAETLPSYFYSDDEYFAESKELIFSRCWQYAGDLDMVKVPGQIAPVSLLDDFLSEPIMFTRDFDDRLHCLSNVCTHRGNILLDGACNERVIRCRYHGRKFGLDGKFVSMPEFEGVANFPSSRDNLPAVPFDSWNKLLFVSLRPAAPLQTFMNEMFERMSWFSSRNFLFDPSRSKEYLVRCHWALYCENYLEGFHIPFVHSSLNAVLDYSSYITELYPLSCLQLGTGKDTSGTFQLPEGHADTGRNASAYYYWIFPNMMFNFYPWGLSLNIVRPVRKDLTRVSFLSYVTDESFLDKGAGAELDKVEREDEAIVENVQRGIRSSLYERGRYSPYRETGVHHFHRLICDFMNS